MQAPLTDTLKPNTPLRRISRIAKWVVVIAGVFWFARFAYLRITLRPTPRPEYWAGQIAALDPPGPDAISAVDAERILGDRSWEAFGPVGWNQQPQPIPTADLLYGEWNPARLEFRQYEQVFRSTRFDVARGNLIRAVELGWDPQFVASPDLSFTSLRNGSYWAEALLLHARWICATTGDMGAAASDWRVVLLLGRQLGRRRMSIDESARARFEGILANQILSSINQMSGSINVQEFAEFLEQVRPSPHTPMRYLEGERFFEQSILEFSYVREGGDWLDVSECAFQMMDSWGVGNDAPARLWNLTSPVFHDFPTACRRLDSAFERLQSILTLGECEPLTRWDSRILDVDSMSVLEGGHSKHLKLLSLTIQRSLIARTQCEGAVTAMALAEYRRQYGEYPVSLESLVPALLHHVPIDYGDRKPLRYRRLENDEYLLYSIGLDGKDDGGQVGSTFEKTPDRFHLRNPDAVFSMVQRLEPSR